MGRALSAKTAFRQLAETVSENQSDDFFQRLTVTLKRICHADHLWIARVDSTGAQAHTLAAWIDGGLVENFSYSVPGTPCDFQDGLWVNTYRSNLEGQFPDAGPLPQLQAESYLGVPITGSAGQRLGLIAVFWKHTEPYPEHTPEVIRIAALQAGGELERRSIEAGVHESERRLQTLMSHLPGMAYQCRVDECWTPEFVSDGVEKLTGYSYHDMVVARRVTPMDLYHPDDVGWVEREVQRCLDNHEPFEITCRFVRADGSQCWIWERGQGIFDEEGQLVRLEGFVTDVTDRHLAQRTERAVLEIAEAVTARSGVDFFHQLATHLASALQADAVFIATYPDSGDRDELEMKALVVDGRHRRPYRFTAQVPLAQRVLQDGAYILREGAQFDLPSGSKRRSAGAEGYVGWRLDNADGEPVGLVAVLSREPWQDPDLALSVLKIFGAGAARELERHRTDQQMRDLAYSDPVTGLPNRTRFMQALDRYQEQKPADSGSLTCVIFDIHRFKEINDTLGYAVGDEVLQALSERCRTVLEPSDLLARLGGDEFAVLIPELESSAISGLVDGIQAVMAQPLDVGHRQVRVHACLGVAHYPGNTGKIDELFRHSSIALHHAKKGDGRVAVFDQFMADDVVRQQALYERLQVAIDQRRLMVYYQPQIDLLSGRLMGAEVLCRWHDTELGWISPGEFIPLAEERGLIKALGEWVLQAACDQLQDWDERQVRFPGALSVNLSARQFDDDRITQDIIHCCGNLDTSRLRLELTESGFMRDPDQTVRITRMLREAGFGLSIDDFGTGYSSLAYLRRFSADTLKIDMSFTREMLVNEHDKTIVETIIAMARTLGMKTVAEGVETAEQADALLAMGCDQAQGYFYGRPVAAEEFQSCWLSAE